MSQDVAELSDDLPTAAEACPRPGNGDRKAFKMDGITGLLDLLPSIGFASAPRASEDSETVSSLRVMAARQRLDQLLNQCLELVSLSILEGEYVLDPATHEKLTTLQEKLATGVEQLKAQDDPGRDELALLVQQAFYKPFGLIVTSYLKAINRIRRQYDFEKRNSHHETNRLAQPGVLAMFSGKFQVCQYIIRSIELDHQLSLDAGVVTALYEMRDRVAYKGWAESLPEAEALLVKCDFLLRKVKWRISQRHDFSPYQFDLDWNGISLEAELPWDEDAALYYELQDHWNGALVGRYLNMRGLRIFNEGILTLKALGRNLDGQADLAPVFSALISAADSIPDNGIQHRAARQVLSHYFSNCQFSRAMDGLSAAAYFEQVEELLGPVRAKQQASGVRCFHPFKKAAIRALDILSAAKPKDAAAAALYQHHIKVTQGFMQEYQEGLTWCRSRQYPEFLLPPQECLAQVGSHRLYVASSMSLPIDYLQAQRDVSQLRKLLAELSWQEQANPDAKRPPDKEAAEKNPAAPCPRSLDSAWFHFV